MNYKCIIKRLGTLIYPRTSVDPLKCLFLALLDLDSSPEPIYTPREPNILRDAGNIINDMIHTEITRIKGSNVDLPTFSLNNS